MKLQFKTKLMSAGKTATGIRVPDHIVDKLGAGKKPPVLVSINGYTYRNTIAVMGGEYLIGVSAAHREGAQVKAGDMLNVSLELDEQPRIAEVPEDFKKLLTKNKSAFKIFEALSYSKKQGILIPIKEAKTEETRLRRMQKTIENLISESKK